MRVIEAHLARLGVPGLNVSQQGSGELLLVSGEQQKILTIRPQLEQILADLPDGASLDDVLHACQFG